MYILIYTDALCYAMVQIHESGYLWSDSNQCKYIEIEAMLLELVCTKMYMQLVNMKK